jgi:hypothetical protein
MYSRVEVQIQLLYVSAVQNMRSTGHVVHASFAHDLALLYAVLSTPNNTVCIVATNITAKC